jgi:crotonobetainyl-CoA:carnitine CoA-transferase CaiB-like acyl-CoA transferase
MVVEVPLHTGETVRMPGIPMKFTAAPRGPIGSPPVLGAHTDRVLSDVLGYSPQRVQALREAGAIG